MIFLSFSVSSSYAFLPQNLPEVSQVPYHVRVIEGKNITAYARPLCSFQNNHKVPTSDPHEDVAELILTRTDDTFGCTGTLVNDNIHVFISAPCVVDDVGNDILLSSYATFERNSHSVTISIDESNSVYRTDYDGDFITGNDIAIMKIANIINMQDLNLCYLLF